MAGMIVPRFWAEGRLQEKTKTRQITVRRWGWSDESQESAQTHADARTREAFDRILTGEKLSRSEGRVAYNGADGVPIREEILSRHGESIITRNSYGAQCLNTPDVLFADVDIDKPKFPCFAAFVISVTCAGVVTLVARKAPWEAGCVTIPLTLMILWACWLVYRLLDRTFGVKPEVRARDRIRHTMKSRPRWRARIYRSPAGYRILVVHKRFDPAAREVVDFFRDLGSDPIYVRMCLRQRCFRARVSPKPWRIGIGKHLRPRPGVWPLRPERLPDRERWVAAYETASTGYASCRYEESLGDGEEDPKVALVRELHDELSRALSSLPIA